MEVEEGTREHLDKAILVALRDSGNSYAVKVDSVLPMKRPAANAKFHYGRGGSARCKLDYIYIPRGPLQSEQERYDETADAIEAHGRIYRLIEFFEERV